MRIVGGKLKGRALKTLKGSGTRPTSERVREAVFNLLVHSKQCPPLDGVRVIDLFAGTGALGIEAISRGASYALFVEDSASARAVIRQNIEALGLQGITRIFRRDATCLGAAGLRDRYAFAFVDPPYGKDLGGIALKALASGGWLIDGAVAVIEERAGQPIELPEGFESFDARTYGDTAITFASYMGRGCSK